MNFKFNIWDAAGIGAGIGTLINAARYAGTGDDRYLSAVAIGTILVLIFMRLAGRRNAKDD